jgi:hypothetical protein
VLPCRVFVASDSASDGLTWKAKLPDILAYDLVSMCFVVRSLPSIVKKVQQIVAPKIASKTLSGASTTVAVETFQEIIVGIQVIPEVNFLWASHRKEMKRLIWQIAAL